MSSETPNLGLVDTFLAQLEASGAPLDADRIKDLQELEARIGYSFQRRILLDIALTHASLSRQGPSRAPFDYERLEFLGDSLLGYIAGEHLLLSDHRRSEGELTRMRSYLVSEKPLARLSQELGLGEYLRLGASERKNGVATKRAILADLFESVTAAIYLDGGLESAREFVLRAYQPLLAELRDLQFDYKDYKSRLQEWTHAHLGQTPRYLVSAEKGPPHNRTFEVEVVIDGSVHGEGVGKTKRAAEQQSARRALDQLVSSSGSSEKEPDG